MRQDVFAVKPRAIGGDEVQPAGHDICGFDGVFVVAAATAVWWSCGRCDVRLRRCALGCDRQFCCAKTTLRCKRDLVALWLPK